MKFKSKTDFSGQKSKLNSVISKATVQLFGWAGIVGAHLVRALKLNEKFLAHFNQGAQLVIAQNCWRTMRWSTIVFMLL